jgi:hypothetical protein
MNSLIAQFSQHLFWDVNREELDPEKHLKFIVQRALGHGLMRDWHALKRCYSLATIVATAKGLRALDPKTLAFIACVGEALQEEFRCFTNKPSARIPWIP